jgi:putative aminopeptidase FrvX
MSGEAQLLRELTDISAPSGSEDAMVACMASRLGDLGLRPEIDVLGNVTVHLGGAAAAGGLLISAHMDEVGFVVTRIDPDGFLSIQRIGGLEERVLASRAVVLLGERGPVRGVIGSKAHHLVRPEEKYVVTPVDRAYVDVGARSRADALALGLEIGVAGTYAPSFIEQGSRVFAKALDDRIQCLALLRLAQRLRGRDLPWPVSLVASVQEEFNIRGVVPAVRRLRPSMHVCLDIVPAPDAPGHDSPGVHLGAGPAVGMYSFHARGTLNGLLPHPGLKRALLDLARESGLPVQRSVFHGGLTESSYAQVVGAGVAAVDLSIPVRYTHSPFESADLADMEAELALLERFVTGGPARVDLARGGAATDPAGAQGGKGA